MTEAGEKVLISLGRYVIQAMADTVGEIRLIADGTKAGFGCQLLITEGADRRDVQRHEGKWVRPREYTFT